MKILTILFFAMLGLSGCDTSWNSPDTSTRIQPQGAIDFNQSGNAKLPSNMIVTETETLEPLESFAVRFIGKKDDLKNMSFANPVKKTFTRKVEVKGAATFEPPAPPSPGEKAVGWSVGGIVAFAMGLLALAGVFLYLKNGHAALWCVTGAGIALLMGKWFAMDDAKAVLVASFFACVGLAVWLYEHRSKTSGTGPPG